MLLNSTVNCLDQAEVIEAIWILYISAGLRHILVKGKSLNIVSLNTFTLEVLDLPCIWTNSLKCKIHSFGASKHLSLFRLLTWLDIASLETTRTYMYIKSILNVVICTECFSFAVFFCGCPLWGRWPFCWHYFCGSMILLFLQWFDFNIIVYQNDVPFDN